MRLRPDPPSGDTPLLRRHRSGPTKNGGAMTRRYVAVCAAVAAPLLLGATAEATTAIALSNQMMTQEADLIATGRCTELRSAWQGRALVTLATVALTDVL